MRPSGTQVEEYNDYQTFRRALRVGQLRPGMALPANVNTAYPEDIAVRVNFRNPVTGNYWDNPSPWIRIRGSDAYVIAVNPTNSLANANRVTFQEPGWQQMTDAQMGYQGQAITINQNNIRVAFQDAVNLGTTNVQRTTLPVVAFVLSEAMRFEAVGNAIDRLYASNVAGDETALAWSDFAPLLLNWNRLCTAMYGGVRTFAIPLGTTLDFLSTLTNPAQNLIIIINRLRGQYPP